MCVGVALAISEIPVLLIEQHGLMERVHDRGGDREARFLWRAHPTVLPVWWNGRLHVVRWGNRDRRVQKLPPSGWSGEETVESGRDAPAARAPKLHPPGWAARGCGMAARVYTVGHSDRPIGAFLKLLHAHGVELLADVRRFPGSRKHPQYGRDALRVALGDAGVGYAFLGETLGGRRPRSLPPEDSPNGGLASPSFRNYADYMLTPEFRAGVDDLLALAARQTMCVMCSEGWWVKCHRRLLADDLVSRGVEVRHISSRVRADPHHLDPLAVVVGGPVTYPPGGAPPGGGSAKATRPHGRRTDPR